MRVISIVKKRRSLFQKVISLFTGFLLIFQSLTPSLFIPSKVFAEDSTPPEVTTTEAPSPNPTVIIEPTQTPQPTVGQPLAEIEIPEVTPTIAPTETDTPTPTTDVTPTITPTIEVVPTESTEQPKENSPPTNNDDSSTNEPTTTPTATITPEPGVSETPTEIGELQATILKNVKSETLDLDGVNPDGSASLSTDKADYAPTDTAIITGKDFIANKTYQLTISSTDEPATATTADVTMDESGTFIYAYQLDGIYRPNYNVEVKNEEGTRIASIDFADHQNYTIQINNGDATTSSRTVTITHTWSTPWYNNIDPRYARFVNVSSGSSCPWTINSSWSDWQLVTDAGGNRFTSSWTLRDEDGQKKVCSQTAHGIGLLIESASDTIEYISADTTPPVISSHTDISVPNTSGQNGAIITYTNPTATDNRDATITVTCTPPSGTFFPIGATTTTCSASDVAGNNALSVTFTITVIDNELPTISIDGANPQTIEAGTPYVELGATVTDNSGSITPIIDATDVYTSNVGSYAVYYDAIDASGNQAIRQTRTVDVVDTTAPSIPTNGAPHNTFLPTNNFNFTWDASTDISSITYEFQSSLNPAQTGDVLTTSLWKSGILPTNMIHSSGAPDGTWYWQVRAKDSFGHTSAWSPIWNVTLDKIAPTVNLVFPTPSASAHSFQAVFSENVNQADAKNPANYFLNNWPGAGGSGDLIGDASITYDAPSKTSTITFIDSGWYISPEQQWGIENIHDLAGNIQQTNPYTEYSTTPTPPITTDSGINTNWHNTPVTVTLTCTDTNGSGCKTTYYTTDGTTPTTASPSGNSFTLSIAGTYTIKYFSIDNAGNVESVKTATNNVKIDTTSPFVQITAPTVSLTNSNSIDIRGTVTDNNPHHYWLVVQNSSGTTVAGPGTVNNANSFTDQLLFTWNTTSVPDGTYTIKLEARDAADNKTMQSVTSKTITIDKTAPSIPSGLQFKNPNLSCGAITNIKTVTIDWADSTDDVGIAGYDYSINYPLPSGSRGTWNTFFTQSQYRGSLNEGLHNIQVRAKDTAGNVSDWTPLCGITYDSIAPALIEKTTFEGWYNTNQTSTFTYNDVNGIASGGDVSCDITTEGTNQTCSVTPNVCDAAGNCNTTPVTSNGANIDFTMPTSVITTPENEQSGSTVYTNAWDGSILGTADDALSGVQGVQVSIQNSLGQFFDGTAFIDWEEEILLDTEIIEGNWEYTGLTEPLEDSYIVRSHAIDNAANRENTYEITVVFDKTIPEVTLSINPTTGDGENGWYKTQPEITLTATDEHINIIEYQWNSDTGEWTTYTDPFKPANEGAHILYYRALDLANNYSGTGIKNIAWDKTALEKAPQNVSVSPNPSNGKNVKVTWEAATDNTGVDHYTITWKKDGVDERGTNVSETTREYIIPDTLTEGVWNVKVTAVDKAGFTADASVNATVDLTAPAAPTLALTGTGVGSVSLAWNAVEGAVDYSVWYGTTAGTYDYAAHVGNVTSYTIQGLGAGTYYVVVAAYDNVVNRSAFSNEVNTGGAIVGAPGATTGPAEGFQPSGSVLGSETVNPEDSGQALGTTTTATPSFSWWFILIGLLLIIIALYIYYRQRRKNR